MISALKNIIKREQNLKKLINKGLVIGKNFSRQNGCLIDSSHCFLISIGNNVTLAPRVHILAHDASTKKDLNYTKIGLVSIGNNVFIGAGSIILPGIKLGNNTIVGAGSVVTKSFLDNSVICGNPAKYICSYDEYIQKNRIKLNESYIFNEEYRIKNITKDKKKEMIEKLQNGIGYIK